jgi:hypothetical protein
LSGASAQADEAAQELCGQGQGLRSIKFAEGAMSPFFPIQYFHRNCKILSLCLLKRPTNAIYHSIGESRNNYFRIFSKCGDGAEAAPDGAQTCFPVSRSRIFNMGTAQRPLLSGAKPVFRYHVRVFSKFGAAKRPPLTGAKPVFRYHVREFSKFGAAQRPPLTGAKLVFRYHARIFSIWGRRRGRP